MAFPVTGPVLVGVSPPDFVSTSPPAQFVALGYCERAPIITLEARPEEVMNALGGVIYSTVQFYNGKVATVETKLTSIDWNAIWWLSGSSLPVTLWLAYIALNTTVVFPRAFTEALAHFDHTLGTSAKAEIRFRCFRFFDQGYSVDKDPSRLPCMPVHVPFYTVNGRPNVLCV